MKNLGLYIHIPFCVHKCDYCDFVSYVGQEKLYEQYVQALILEVKSLSKLKKYEIDTIYFGGGTPSILNEKYIKQIMNIIKNNLVVKENAEITVEVNPGTVTKQKLKNYIQSGINRISIGLQETHNELLKQISRIHTYEQFLQTYDLARKAGFKNINIDLMIGLPNQKIEQVKENIKRIIELNPEHISIYSLIVEEGTKIYKDLENGKISLPDELVERKMYWLVKKELEKNGYIQYEISNFCKKDYKSKHNYNCWEQKEYIGVGIAAHSYINQKRFSNITNLQNYIKNCKDEKFEDNRILHEIQTIEEMKKEYMLLGLRTINGISIQKFKQKFGENPIYIFRKELQKLVEEKLLEIDSDRIYLTNKGIDLANLVWEEFV